MIGALAAMLGGCASADLTAYQADPLTATPPDSPNWALAAAPEAGAAAEPTLSAPIFATGPAEVLAALDAVVAAAPRTEKLAPAWPGADPATSRAYLQRSAVIGFPDVVSAVVVDLGAGDAGQRATVALYSRSVYGYSDLGVNADRLKAWIAALSEQAPMVDGRGASD